MNSASFSPFSRRNAFETYGINAAAVDKAIRDKAMEKRRESPDSFGFYLSFDNAQIEDIHKATDALYEYYLKEAPNAYSSDEAKSKLKDEMDNLAEEISHDNTPGWSVYDEVTDRLGSPMAASQFLSSIGFTGISYPAQYKTGGRFDNARNYVIFNESDLKITDRVEFLRNGDIVYGAVVGGRILLNKERLGRLDSVVLHIQFCTGNRLHLTILYHPYCLLQVRICLEELSHRDRAGIWIRYEIESAGVISQALSLLCEMFLIVIESNEKFAMAFSILRNLSLA